MFNVADRLLLQRRVISFNTSLASAIENLSANKPDLRMHMVDSFSKLNAVLTNPAAHGLTKTFPDAVTDSALTDKSFTGPGADYVYWDPRHPTSKIHRLISDWHREVLTGAAPERLQVTLAGAFLELTMQKLKVCREYQLQSSTNFVDWTDASTFVASAGTNQVRLPLANESATFYRLKWNQ
jgi:phospholipase/lecithinase/hemolysin